MVAETMFYPDQDEVFEERFEWEELAVKNEDSPPESDKLLVVEKQIGSGILFGSVCSMGCKQPVNQVSGEVHAWSTAFSPIIIKLKGVK